MGFNCDLWLLIELPIKSCIACKDYIELRKKPLSIKLFFSPQVHSLQPTILFIPHYCYE
uniref:Uncharacterized protein n=1 Tax=Rhizophora mucronata TaxID=61149 RepID=A0A2P2ITF6_RHIMU